MTIDELDTDRVNSRDYGDYHLVSQPVSHTGASLAYRVTGPNGKSFVYSGDTGYCQAIIDLAKGADVLVLECALPEGEEVEGHLTPSLAGKIAQSAGVKKLVLVHFYPEALQTDLAGSCRKTFEGEMILGRDLLHIHL
jgi:ribonuclease BN (tRNA processing enzyme)